MQDFPENELPERLSRYPLFSDVFGHSLQIRISKPNWFENRFIQAILRDTDWIEEHERILAESNIKEVKNWEKIFSDVGGDDRDYDLKIFDVLAEVRLIHWAKENGYTDIEKLIPSGATPDFIMKRDRETTIAEAKHFRARDFLPDFVEDRLRGLRFKTGYLTRFGISADTTDKYGRIRDFLLETRKWCESCYQDAIRDEFTEEWLKALECSLTDDPRRELDIIFNLFVVRRLEIPGEATVGLFGPIKNRGYATELMLEKLCGNLMSALKQIKSFIDRNPSREYLSRALVFLSGTNSWSWEWNDMWETLKSKDSTIWEKVNEVHTQASKLIRIPFELIVGKDKEERGTFAGHPATIKTPEYAPFPWTHDEMVRTEEQDKR